MKQLYTGVSAFGCGLQIEWGHTYIEIRSMNMGEGITQKSVSQEKSREWDLCEEDRGIYRDKQGNLCGFVIKNQGEKTVKERWCIHCTKYAKQTDETGTQTYSLDTETVQLVSLVRWLWCSYMCMVGGVSRELFSSGIAWRRKENCLAVINLWMKKFSLVDYFLLFKFISNNYTEKGIFHLLLSMQKFQNSRWQILDRSLALIYF